METQTQPESVTFKVPEDPASIEKEQEAKLKAKYGPLPKYFDSGDYNMAKAKMNNPKKPLPAREKLMLQESLGAAIPTPGEVEHMRRPSQIASKLLIHDVEGEGDGQIDG
ncbi:AR19A-like protein [Mya arenaria]|uniref:AR19A-like protein n=1 Tax=Mya arenaria TaxID=6604 RepID=A0ABY7DMK1_MYAAR|nr:AR19A-like protein [Mya arenaria]